MTAYSHPIVRSTPEAVREAKEKRRHVLEAAERTRKANYHRFLQRMASVQKTLQEKKQHKNRKAIEETLALAGSWNDIPSDAMEEQLDRIRHASKPTPPFEFDG